MTTSDEMLRRSMEILRRRREQVPYENPNQKALKGLIFAMLFQAAVVILVPALLIAGIVWAVWKWWV